MVTRVAFRHQLLLDSLRAVRQAADREVGAAREVAQAGKQAEADVAALREARERHERAAALLTTIGEQRQESARRQVEELVTRGLQVIFGEELSFHLEPGMRGSQPVVEFVIRSVYGDQVVDTPVLDARGGGMAVVVAFMLRLVVLLLTPGARRVLFLDESFSHVSAEYEPRVAEFLREVCDQAGVQVIMVTHSDAYNDVADQRYRLELASNGAAVLCGLRPEDLS